MDVNVLAQWLCNKIYKKEIGNYLYKELHVKTVAVYGAGKYGELVYDDLLANGKVEVLYFIDKNADSLYYGIDDVEIYSLSELKTIPQVDLIIVTPYLYFEEIKANLKSKLEFDFKIISIEDLIWKVE